MLEDRAYSETLDQPALTALFDIDQARSADSFDKFCRELQRIIYLLKQSFGVEWHGGIHPPFIPLSDDDPPP